MSVFSRMKGSKVKGWGILFLLLLPALLGPARAQQSDGDDVTIVAEGMAPLNGDLTAAEEEAVWDAKRNAVEQAVGVVLRSHTVGRDHRLQRDDIETRAEGFIRHWERLSDSRRIETVGHGRILHLQIRATVALLPVIHKLSDIADVYKDLERPRLRVQVTADGKSAAWAQTTQDALVAALQGQGFALAESGPAEVVLTGRLEVMPTVHLGDHDAPYGIGDSVAASRATLKLQVVSTASEDVLFTADSVGSGHSFASDQEACAEAAADAADTLLKTSEQQFVDRLLVRWAREREEGHTVAIQVTGLDDAERAQLRQEVRAMRGFLQFTGESGDRNRCTLRFLTRLETSAVRHRLAALRFTPTTHPVSLTVLNDRGPVILCAVHAPPRSSHQ